jgi:hypothetical protein
VTYPIELLRRAVHLPEDELADVVRQTIECIEELRASGDERRANNLARTVAVTIAIRGYQLPEAKQLMRNEVARTRSASNLRALAKVLDCAGDTTESGAMLDEAKRLEQTE